MNVLFMHSDNPRERVLADRFVEGICRHGDGGAMMSWDADYEISATYDAICMVGVKSISVMRECWKKGVHSIYFDKGYDRRRLPGPVRGTEYWRVAVDAQQPIRFLETMSSPSDRWESLGHKFKPWRERSDGHILIAGSSAKYHNFFGLPHPTDWVRRLVTSLNKMSPRPVVYRPKQSYLDAVPVEGADFSHRNGRSIYDDLRGAHVLITHGSNASFEAALVGIPSIVLGEGIGKPISSTRLDDIEEPKLAHDKERLRWFSNLAYCQWMLREMALGEAWPHIKTQIV